MFESTRPIEIDVTAEQIDFEKLFGRRAPVQIDLGCGDGLFLSQMAIRHPKRNFLGIERLVKRVTRTARKAARLPNMRVLRVDTSHVLTVLLPSDSVEAFYLLFPDPWPKRRHHRRRIVTISFLKAIHRALEPTGTLQIATDHADYFEQIERTTAQCVPPTRRLFEFAQTDETQFPQTRFEQRFRAADRPIYRLSLRKISPVT